ncbi:5-oxoprolinase subunit C family protein [Reinekea forsetii]|jgi:biotin-dependent carboxylase-like uncharacterized protein|uniref:Allophanate hydrolase 2 subunit 2 n=1 Tax=Reinekea forsetii TaxID=1336806 RepID=A0A2K8KR33_9GAMM|nr:biotin-dependent carboxyltransferase family protein [Reinekea forsetii]ATX75356.1 allophanate hydrolase 2 subunit 2 [Reinekea forsetii]
MSLVVVKTGLLAQIHDRGRYGYGAHGLTHSGPMDEVAHCWANWLLDNPLDSASLEITYGQLGLECQAACSVALTGADLGATLNGLPVKPWRRLELRPGDRLCFATPVQGMRACLALLGGIQCKKSFGSASTVKREKVGGMLGDGSAIKVGDRIAAEQSRPAPQRTMPEWAIPTYRRSIELGLIPGYQFTAIPALQRALFFSGQYRVTDKIDRMGYRLKGDAIETGINGIVSEGIALGSVQIPSDGQPIVLMRDRQTIGGYPKIGTVFSLDLALLGQAMPGDWVSFKLMDVADAENRRLLFERNFA